MQGVIHKKRSDEWVFEKKKHSFLRGREGKGFKKLSSFFCVGTLWMVQNIKKYTLRLPNIYIYTHFGPF